MSDEPVPVKRGLDRLLDHLTGTSAATTSTVFERWASVVGDAVASHTRPVKLREGVLTVAVDDPAWASQLAFLEGDLLKALGEHDGGEAVARIELVVRRCQ